MDTNQGRFVFPVRTTGTGDIEAKGDGERLPRSLYFVGAIVFVQLFSDTLAMLDLNQYAYTEFKKIDHPYMNVNSVEESKYPYGRYTNETELKTEEKVQEEVSLWSVYMSFASGLPTIISATLLPAMSDRYGRKHCLLIPLFGNFLKNAMTSIGIMLDLDMHLFHLFLFVDGLSGSWIAIIAICCSYIADITSVKDKSLAMAILGFCIGTGILSATLVSGYFIECLGFAVPVVMSSGCNIFVIMLVLCCLSESLQDTARAKGVQPLSHLCDALDYFLLDRKSGSTERRWKFVIYITVFYLISIGSIGKINIEIFYQIGSPFYWTSTQISYFFTLRSVVQEVMGIVMIRIFQHYISDILIVTIGTISACGYFVIEGLASTSFQLYMGKDSF